MKQRALTLVEVVVASGVLFSMVALTAMATLSYLRAYRLYTDQSLKLRQTAKTLEVLCTHLRSSRRIQFPLPSSLRESPLLFEKADRRQYRLQVSDQQLLLFQGQSQQRLGNATDVILTILPGQSQGLLEITLKAFDNQSLKAAIPLRGLRP